MFIVKCAPKTGPRAKVYQWSESASLCRGGSEQQAAIFRFQFEIGKEGQDQSQAIDDALVALSFFTLQAEQKRRDICPIFFQEAIVVHSRLGTDTGGCRGIVKLVNVESSQDTQNDARGIVSSLVDKELGRSMTGACFAPRGGAAGVISARETISFLSENQGVTSCVK